MLGQLTHRQRSLACASENIRTSALSKAVGKDDLALIVADNCGSFTHYIEEIWLEDGWCWGKIKILDEEGMDSIAKENILRLKGMLKQGIKLPLSCVIVGAWSPIPGTGTEILDKLLAIKGVDATMNESFRGSGVVEIYDDNDEKMFSATTANDKIKVKTFSSPSEAGIDLNLPKTSKINGRVAIMKAKEFSFTDSLEFLGDETTEQKQFSVSSIKERVRYAKFAPRQRFRRLVMEYKAAVRSMGGPEKMDEETLSVMKSLFATDVLDIMKSITPDIMAGKPIGTLIGASSLGKNIRVTTQKMQMPMKMALQQAQKQSYVTKNIYEKIQALYIQFIGELTEEVFSSKSTIPDPKAGEVEDEEINDNE